MDKVPLLHPEVAASDAVTCPCCGKPAAVDALLHALLRDGWRRGAWVTLDDSGTKVLATASGLALDEDGPNGKGEALTAEQVEAVKAIVREMLAEAAPEQRRAPLEALVNAQRRSGGQLLA